MNGDIHLDSNYFAVKIMQPFFDYQEGDNIFHGKLCRCKRVCGWRNNEDGDQIMITDNYVSFQRVSFSQKLFSVSKCKIA